MELGAAQWTRQLSRTPACLYSNSRETGWTHLPKGLLFRVIQSSVLVKVNHAVVHLDVVFVPCHSAVTVLIILDKLLFGFLHSIMLERHLNPLAELTCENCRAHRVFTRIPIWVTISELFFEKVTSMFAKPANWPYSTIKMRRWGELCICLLSTGIWMATYLTMY